MKNFGEPGGCPDSEDLFTLAVNAARLTESKRDMLLNHLRSCPLCAEEYREVEERMGEGLEEPDGEGSDVPESLVEKLHDLALHYPCPSVRIFAMDKARSFWRGMRRQWDHLLHYPVLDVSALGMSLVRSMAGDLSIGEEIVDELNAARRAVSSSDYVKAGDHYSRACQSLRGLSMERELHFCAGYSYLAGGHPDRAVEHFIDGIDEETPPSIYWLLALGLFEVGDFEGAYRSLQIVEGLGAELSHEAGRFLDRIDSE